MELQLQIFAVLFGMLLRKINQKFGRLSFKIGAILALTFFFKILQNSCLCFRIAEFKIATLQVYHKSMNDNLMLSQACARKQSNLELDSSNLEAKSCKMLRNLTI